MRSFCLRHPSFVVLVLAGLYAILCWGWFDTLAAFVDDPNVIDGLMVVGLSGALWWLHDEIPVWWRRT